MKKSSKKKYKKRIGLYLPESLVKLLKLKADKEERSLNYTVVKILETSLQ